MMRSLINTTCFFISLLRYSYEVGIGYLCINSDIRMSVSNIRLSFIIFPVLLLSSSCNRENNEVIPDITVDFTMYSSDPSFFELFSTIGSSVVLSSAYSYLGYGTGGYDGNGIIIYNTGDPYLTFYAYDRTCPHCWDNEGLSIAVNVDGIYAICPHCNTNYALPGSGQPTSSGPGQYYLKNYRTASSGSSLRVWNKK